MALPHLIVTNQSFFNNYPYAKIQKAYSQSRFDNIKNIKCWYNFKPIAQ